MTQQCAAVKGIGRNGRAAEGMDLNRANSTNTSVRNIYFEVKAGGMWKRGKAGTLK